MNEYGKRKQRLKVEVSVYLVDDQLQMIEKDNQIYFYVNLFNPLKSISSISEKILNE